MKNAFHEAVQSEVDRIPTDAVRTSKGIYAQPELGLHEAWACDFLVAGMEMAIIARHSSQKKGLKIAFLCQYDALPGLGHGCGHNAIAAAFYGAALSLKPIVDTLEGSVCLIGSADEAFAVRVKAEVQAYEDAAFSNVPGIPPEYLPFPSALIEDL